MFSKQHDVLIALLHTMIGFVMLLVVVWHLCKNYRPLIIYTNPLKKYLGKYNYALPLALVIITYVAIAPFFRLSPAMQVYQFGQSLRAADQGEQDDEIKYVSRQVSPENATGQTITVELKKGPYFMWPQYAMWLETIDGDFVQPLYVTNAIATNNFTNKVSKTKPDQVFTSHLLIGPGAIAESALTGGEDAESKDTRMRPESLPVFLHKLGLQAQSGFFVPTDNSLEIDGFSGATMTDNFVYSVKLNNSLVGKYRVRLELNHSFDYNEYYSSDRFPDDLVYSGDGFSAQPSVVYESIVDFSNKTSDLSKMTVIGRGHHSGEDGALYTDLDNLTTALQLVDRVLISYSESGS